METIEQRIKKIIGAQVMIDAADIKDTDHIVNTLGADSLDVVELTMAIEDEFKIEVSDETMEKCTTVQSVISTVTQAINTGTFKC